MIFPNTSGDRCHKGSSRRRFIQSCCAMATGSITSSILQLQLTQQLLAQTGGTDYKALVCLFLDGGNDSHNMLVPYEQTEYDDYFSIRLDPNQGGLALSRDSLLPITTSGGRSFGMHPAMTGLKQLYDQGDVAFVANVGSLVEPTDYSDYQSNNNLPLGLFSHADLTRHWQTGLPQSRAAATGWGGRAADILTDPADRDDPIPLAISLDQVNRFQSAVYANPYVVTAYEGAVEYDAFESNWAPDVLVRTAMEEIFARNDTNLLRQTYQDLTRQSIEAASQYNQATSSVTFNTEFPQSYLARQLERIARTIAAAPTLGHSRQTFFVSYGGWDHHNDLLGPQNNMLGQVSAALSAFHACLSELGLNDSVTTFTASDFGRTLAGNGQGSDHGWGGNQMVMGGSVSGGDVYGEYPLSLATGNPLDLGRGRLIPTMSVDEYAAELVMWMGIGNNSDLETVLPNIRNFYATGSTDSPVGFLA